MADLESYEDPIITLVKDPNLNKEKSKTSQLIRLINSFPLSERKVSKLCQTSFNILQNLEKISLNLKNWEFLSLNINSDSHFNNKDSQIKDFNNSIAEKVIVNCKELNRKLNKISSDLDFVTKSSRMLTPIEYLSDSGTMLTSLVLRNIKLKNEMVDNITVSYSKAKLILIGKDLELMLNDSDTGTVLTYKSFIVNLMKQLNNAIEMEEMETKYECLAVINDMEKMFDAFKLEKMKEVALYNQEETTQEADQEDEAQDYVDIAKEVPNLQPQQNYNVPSHQRHQQQRYSPQRQSPHLQTPHMSHSALLDDDDYEDYDSDVGSTSLYSSTLSQPPLIHSITKTNDSSPRSNRRDSISSLSIASMLHKTTISDELPYLMTAFNSAKNFEEDVSHFKEEEEKELMKKKKPLADTKSTKEVKEVEQKVESHYYIHKPNLPKTSLYSESKILPQSIQTPKQASAASTESTYLYSNNPLLSKLGIRPQVITTNLPSKEINNIRGNNNQLHSPTNKLFIKINDNDEENNKENKRTLIPLTKANLESHNFSRLNAEHSINDYVD